MIGIAAALSFLLAAVDAPANEQAGFDPVRFFTGRTQGKGALKELVGKPRPTTTTSVGRLDKDGWLVLDQKVVIEGDPPRHRKWRLRQVAPGLYRGTLSDAKGEVEAVVTSKATRIRYMLKGGIKVDQKLTPLPGGRAVANRAIFRKFGMRVATLTEQIEKR